MSQDLHLQASQSLNFKDQWGNVLKKLNNEYGNEIFNSWIKNIKIQEINFGKKTNHLRNISVASPRRISS